MVWIFFLSINRELLATGINYRHPLSDRNRIEYSFYLFQIESSGTFLTSHFSTNAISYSVRHSIIRSFPMVWIFFLSTKPETTCNEINYRHLPSDRNRIDIPSIFSKSNLLELFSQATLPQCYITYCQTLKNWVSSDGLDFFSYQQTGTTCNGINYRHLPRTGTANILLLSLSNRIFWNFSHKTLFHNAISHSVRH